MPSASASALILALHRLQLPAATRTVPARTIHVTALNLRLNDKNLHKPAPKKQIIRSNPQIVKIPRFEVKNTLKMMRANRVQYIAYKEGTVYSDPASEKHVVSAQHLDVVCI